MTTTPELVLVNPGSRAKIYQSLGATLTAVENPVWAGLIATFVRTKGYTVAIVDAEGDELTPDQAAARVVALKPKLVAVVVYGHQPSASTQNMTGASAIVTAVKNLDGDLPVLMVGGHVASLPERTLDEEACDFVSRDEGLYTIVDLLEAYRHEAYPSLKNIRGLVYRDHGTAVTNPAAPLVKDLDADMPGVAWDLLPMSRYRAHNWHCFGRPSAGAVCGAVHHARLPVSLLLLLYSGAVQARRRGGGPQRRGEQLPILESGAGHPGDRSSGQHVRRPQHQVRRRDVRPQPAARPRPSAT